MNQPVKQSAAGLPANPFAKQTNEFINAGTVAIEESRAVAETQGKLLIAKRFPRDEARAYNQIIASCQRVGLAEQATYSFPRGGQTISGASIRLAEELARVWGNIDFGIRELSQKDGISEMQAYAWDMETNVISSQNFTVKHERHTNAGVKKLIDPRDIYELTANLGGRRLRARILAILPPDLVEAALENVQATLERNTLDKNAINKLLDAFAKNDVTRANIENRYKSKVEELSPSQVVELRGIFTSIRDGISPALDWFADFRPSNKKPAENPEALNALNNALDASKTKPEDKPAPTTENDPAKPGSPENAQKANKHSDKVEKKQPAKNEAPGDRPAAAGELSDDLNI